MKKYTIHILLLFLCVSTAFSQTGAIADAFTHQAISGATVTFDKTGNTVLTDSAGKFSLSCADLPYYITVHTIGYEDVRVKVANCEHPLRAEMTASSVQLNEVQINGWASGEKNNQLYQAQSVGVLTHEDLNRGNGLSLVDAIDLIPGVNMQSRTPFGGDRIIIRGYYGGGSAGQSTPSLNFNGSGYQVAINNVPITDAVGGTIMDDIDFSTLGKVEVIKGPQSTLYGSGIGGVVNLYTVRPIPNATQFSQQAVGGSYGLWRTNTMVTTAGSNYDIAIDYGHQNYDGFRPHDASKKDYVTFTGNYYSDRQTLSAYLSYSKSYEELAGEQDSALFYSHSTDINAPTYVTNNSHIAIESFRAGVTDNFHFNKHFSNQTTLFVSGHTLSQPFAHGFTDYSNINFGARTGFVYDAQIKKVGIHGILGASYLKSDQTSEGVFILPFPPFAQRPSNLRNTAWTSSVFTEWSINLPLQFSIKAGVSANFSKYTTQNYLDTAAHVYFGSPVKANSFSPAVTPSISIAKVFKENVSVYASVSLGYTPPTISAMLDSRGQIDTTLKPERGIQYEVGTKGSFVHKRFSYQLALFYLNVYNKLVTQIGNDGGAAYTFTSNVGQQQNLGVELSLSYAIIENKDKAVSLIRPFISYTYSYFKYKSFNDMNVVNHVNTIVDFSGKRVAGVAPNRLNAGLDFALKYGIYLNATYQFVDKTPYTFDNLHYAKAYNLLSAKIGYHNLFFRHLGLDVYAGLDNILSNTYYNFVFVGENLPQLADGAFLPAPSKPTFYAGELFIL